MSPISCPICSSEMVIRTARRGKNAGNQFWGCTNYPRCKGIVNIEVEDINPDTTEQAANDEVKRESFKTIWYDNLNRENYNSEYITLGSTPLFLSELNISKLATYSNQFNLLTRKSNLSSFNEDANFIGAILQKLLTRGDAPYCSLGIENYLATQKFIKKSVKEYDGKSSSIGWFWNNDAPFDLKNEIVSCIKRKKLKNTDENVIKANTKGIFDSPIEEKFFTKWIPNNFGIDATHWFMPQAPLDRLISSNDDELSTRRVDFLFYHPSSAPIVIELDGEEHNDAAETDLLRDRKLEASGIKVIRIKNQELEIGEGENLNLLRTSILNILDRVSSTKTSEIYQVMRLSSASSTLQFLLAKALSSGNLDFNTNKWKINIFHDFDNDELITSAVNDFAEMFSALRNLYFNQKDSVKIEVIFGKTKSKTIDITLGVFLDESPITLCVNAQHFDFICCPAILPVNISTNINTTSLQKIVSKKDLENTKDVLTVFLQNLFRKRKFRELQDVSVLNVLRHKDTVTLLPTGAGKSIIYQLAGLLQPGITLVVDPIVALIEDQILGLSSVGIDKASAAPTGFNNIRNRQIWLKSIEQGEHQFILISPERLQMTDFRETLRALVELNHINLAVIDEAHCVSEWGHNFRFAYLNLADNLRKFCLSPGGTPPTILALTGTASRAVLRELLVELDINKDDDEALIRPVEFDRPELKFSISKVNHGGDTSNVLRGILNSLPNKFNQPPSDFFKPSGKQTNSGIIFTPHTNGRTHGLFSIKSSVLKNVSVPVTTFSGGAPKGTTAADWEIEKRQNAQDFKENRAPILVATKAFGMGIDKPNIRWTLHMGIPSSMEAFYQEAGRAGRDKNLALCNVIFSEVDSKQTDEALSGEGSLVDLRKAAKKIDANKDDVSRALYFHLNAFSGIEEEYESVSNILSKIGDFSERKKVELTFNNDTKPELERSLLRLKKCGIVEDIEVNYGSKNIIVSIRPFDFSFSRRIVENYIKESQPARLRNIISKLNEIENLNVSYQPQSLCNLMIDFTYDVIERSRRRMLYEAILLGRNYSNDNEIRQYLLDYLQEGLGAEKIAQLAEESIINFDDWIELISKITNPIEAGEIRGISIRLLETYPDHPGILLLRGISESLVQKSEDLLVRNSIVTALENAKTRYDCSNVQLSELFKQLIDIAGSRAIKLRMPLISSMKHCLNNLNVIDDGISQKMMIDAVNWDENSRLMLVASDFEVRVPQLITLAKQRVEHHTKYLNRMKKNV